MGAHEWLKVGNGNENVRLVFGTVVPVTSMTSNVSIGSELSGGFSAKVIGLEVKVHQRNKKIKNIRLCRPTIRHLPFT